MFKILILLSLLGCQRSPLENVGVKLGAVYERDLHLWSARNTGKTYHTPPSEYPAYLRTEKEVVKGKISIRGDLSSHWRDQKKSYKFVTEKGSYFRGLREMDFIILKDKLFELEPLGYEIAKSLNVLTPRWEIINFTLNTKNHGPYLMLERWTPESFEVRGLPEGDVIREANAWIDVIRLGAHSRYKDVFFDKAPSNPIALRKEIYRSMFYGIQSPLALDRFASMLEALGKNQWRDFLNERDAVNWFTVMLVMGSYHGVLGDNMKWYYHPYERKFHLIPYDFLPQVLKNPTCPLHEFGKLNPWIASWLKDDAFRRSLKLKLEELFSSNWPSSIIAEFYKRPEISSIADDERRKEVILKNMDILKKAVSSDSCF